MWEIRPERAGDVGAVEALNRESFGPGRLAKSAYRLREGVAVEHGLSFVAVEGEALLGSIRFWPIVIGADAALLLGPLAVKSDLRGRGIGIALMKHGIAAARDAGHRFILLVGDEPYYSRVGFVRIAPGRVMLPGPVDPARVLGLALGGALLETLEGEMRRARLDDPVCADGAGVGT